MNIDTVLQAKGRHVDTTSPDTPILEVARQMRARRIGALVVTPDGHQIEGNNTERDNVLGLAHDGDKLLRLNAGQVMTKPVITCSPADTIGQVMAVMTRRRVRHLPVVEWGRMCGIISIGDVVKNRVEELELQTNVLRDSYLASH